METSNKPETATAWNNVPVWCDRCGGATDYLKDVDHDDGVCEVFQCRACGARLHNELPD